METVPELVTLTPRAATHLPLYNVPSLWLSLMWALLGVNGGTGWDTHKMIGYKVKMKNKHFPVSDVNGKEMFVVKNHRKSKD